MVKTTITSFAKYTTKYNGCEKLVNKVKEVGHLTYIIEKHRIIQKQGSNVINLSTTNGIA